MDATVTRVFSIELLRTVNLSDFTVTNDLPVANPFDFVDPLPAYDSLGGGGEDIVKGGVGDDYIFG